MNAAIQPEPQPQEKRPPNWNRDRANQSWEDAVMNAAIEQEKVQRQFMEPKPGKAEARAGTREKEPQEKHWPTMPPQPERKSPGLFQEAAAGATRDDRTENLQGPAAQVFALWRSSIPEYHPSAALAVEAERAGRSYADLKAETIRTRQDAAQQRGEGLRIEPDRKAFAAALDHKGISFAVVTKDEAERSHREAEFAKQLATTRRATKKPKLSKLSLSLSRALNIGAMAKSRSRAACTSWTSP